MSTGFRKQGIGELDEADRTARQLGRDGEARQVGDAEPRTDELAKEINRGRFENRREGKPAIRCHTATRCACAPGLS